ncbi:MAG: TonB-dependent receptor, partial [Proteobacteria bacterium]|nr:TonB-dependent receptor [Pseudomonadota bacterium]
TAAFALTKRFDVTGGRLQQNTSDVFQVVGGLDGKLPVRDWTWNVTASYGRNDITILQPNWDSRSGLATLLNAPDGGRSICAGGFDPFGNLPVSAACQAVFTKRLHSTEELDQTIVEGDAQGGLFTLPAGEVRFAAGVDYREDYFKNDPDSLIASGDIIAASGAYFAGRTEVSELYGELLIPILKDLPLIKSLDTDLGLRVSDYNTVGTVTTYKADLSWKTVADITFRGGYERAIRAPNIGELDTPVSQGVTIIGLAGALGSGDPCDVTGAYRKGANAAQVRALCIANGVPTSLVDTFTFAQQSAGIVAGGNSNLREETADTFSVGAVWRPDFDAPLAHNLSVSVDYYNIDVSNAIGSITAPLALSRCFNATGTTNPAYDPSNVFCKLISRNADGTINTVSTQSLNLGGYKTSGVDFQVDWAAPASAFGLPDDEGRFTSNLVTSYLDTFKIQSLPGDPFLDYAGTIGNGQIDPVAISRPHWKSNLYVGYDHGPVTAGVTWRYIGKMENAANVGVASGTAVGVPSVSYIDLNLKYRINAKLELWGTVTNLTDKTPPVYPAVGSTDAATYDVIGRAFTVGLKARF